MLSRRRKHCLPLLSQWFCVTIGIWLATLTTLTAETKVQLRFKNGDFMSGAIAPCQQNNRVALRSAVFQNPLEFQVDSIGSLEREVELLTAPGSLSFVLNNYSTIVGKLVALKEDTVTINSRSLGDVTIPRRLLSEIVDSGGVGKLLFSGPRPSQSWKSQPKIDAWNMDSGSLSTSLVGNVVECDVGLPAVSEVRIKLSWTKAPNFSLAIGTAAAQPGQLRLPAVVQLESWGTTLTLVHEAKDETDFVSVAELATEDGRLDIVLYIDQSKGEITACSPTGQRLGSLSFKAQAGQVGDRFIKLLNASKGKDALRLERVEVRQWSGRLPGQGDLKSSGIVDKDGKLEQGRVTGFDADQQTLTLEREDKSTVMISLGKVSRVLFSGEPTSGVTKDEYVEVQYADSSSCVGTWHSSADSQLNLQLAGMETPLVANFEQVATVSGNSVRYEVPQATARVGALESDQLKLSGSLSDSSGLGELHWLAHCASAPVKLLPEFEGKVVYESAETPTPVAKPNARAQRVNINGGGILAQGVQIFMRNGRIVQNPKIEKQPTITVSAGLKFRTGDSALGKVTKIDEGGVTFTMGDKTIVAPHQKMESVTLVDRARIEELPPDKLKHLMTIPRAAKADPPTHLFVSVDGDYLRGRLVKYMDGRVTAEIRLENVEFPAESIAQIFWLHSRDWEDKKPDPVADVGKEATNNKPPADPVDALPTLLQVHAMTRNEKAMTFTPSKTFGKELEFGKQDQVLQGHSELLGECEVLIGDLKTLLIGRDVGALARKIQKDAWMLSVAQLPKVYQEGDQPAESGSPLVGKPAPNFTLKTTAKENFELSKLKGRVTVLDFWASWCGPCMQTMPEVERIVSEVGAAEVELVAVNLQETKERAMAAVERLALDATVVLDIDGEVAQKYQATAIPQTVIIDREGNVTHVFVGGGPRFLKQFEEALSATLKPKNP